MEITNVPERQFADLLTSNGKTYVSHPLVRLNGSKIIPDFYCHEDQTYYEVIGTRQAYYSRKYKIFKARQAGLNIRVVTSDGKEFPKPKKPKLAFTYIRLKQDFPPLDEKQIRKRLIDLGLSQTDLSKILGIPRNRINDAITGRREGKKYLRPILDYLFPKNAKRGRKPPKGGNGPGTSARWNSGPLSPEFDPSILAGT